MYALVRTAISIFCTECGHNRPGPSCEGCGLCSDCCECSEG